MKGKKKEPSPIPRSPAEVCWREASAANPEPVLTATARFEARTEYTALACHAFNAGQEAFCSPDTAKSVSTRTVEQRHHYNGLVGTTGVCATILGGSKGVATRATLLPRGPSTHQTPIVVSPVA